MVVFETAGRLAASGHTVVTACPTHSPLMRHLQSAGLPALAVRRRHKYFSWSAISTLRRELRTGGQQSVLIHQLGDLWQVVPALIGHPEVRLVAIAHTFVGVRKRDLLHRLLYGRVDCLIALTERHRRNLVAHLPIAVERIEIQPNAVDTRRFRPEAGDLSLRRGRLGFEIGVVSRLDKNKGLLEALTAASLLRDRNVKFHMSMIGNETAGEEGMRSILESEIERLRLGQHVTLVGHVDRVEENMASLDVLLMPAPSETFGRVLIEGMACGVPVVACAGGGVPDVVEDRETGVLVPPGDVTAMADALAELAGSTELRARFRNAGLAKVRSEYESSVVLRKLIATLTTRGPRPVPN